MAWNAYRMKDVPNWAFHGVDDGTVAVTESINMANAVRANGGNIKLSLLPGVNHNAWEPAMYEHRAIEWLLTHRLSDRKSREA
jgi:dipeptidyl aminopeptidase/acylaminoacyl peptidase